MPKISIIVPIYNVEKYLDKCIKSILNQSFEDFELILVNDGSTDSCGVICDKYKKLDGRITVIHKANGGLSSARNAGIDIARGEYIGFVDSDDYIHEKMYEILYNNAKKYNSDIVICKEKNVHENEENKSTYKINKFKVEQFNNIEALKKLYEVRTTFVYAWNKLYKRNLFRDLRYPNGKIYEDEFITPKLIYKATIITYVELELYFYLQRNGSIVKQKFNVRKFDKVDALEDNVKYFKLNKEKELYFLAQRVYTDMFLWNEYAAKAELDNIESELIVLRKKFKKHLIGIINNPLFSYKQKIMLITYNLSSKLYYWISSKY